MNQETIKAIIATIGACCAYLLGGVDVALKALLLFMALDYITGVSAAWHEKKLDSVIGFKGFLKKLLTLTAVIMAAELDKVAGTNGLLRAGAIYYIMANEGLSILENLGTIGILVPPGLIDALERLKDKGEQNAEQTKGSGTTSG